MLCAAKNSMTRTCTLTAFGADAIDFMMFGSAAASFAITSGWLSDVISGCFVVMCTRLFVRPALWPHKEQVSSFINAFSQLSC
jgi:hypothetical protein